MVERKGQEKREVRRCDVEGGKKTERLNPISHFCLQFWSSSSFLADG